MRSAARFHSTVLIEGMMPGESMTFEQLVARSEKIARDTGANDLRARIFATDFLATWYSANGWLQKAEELLTRTLDSLPADPPHWVRGCAAPRQLVGRPGPRRRGTGQLTAMIARTDLDDAVPSQCLLAAGLGGGQ